MQRLFAWKQGLFSSLLVKAFSWVLHPLEQGTYRGRALAGEPHRSSRVIASPLTVFVIPEGRRHKLFLAARLRVRSPINIIHDPAADAKPEASQSADKDKKREARAEPGDEGRKKTSEESRADGPADVDCRGPVCGGTDFCLEELIAIQRASAEELMVVPVTRAFHQHNPEAPPTTFSAKVYWFRPMHLMRRTASFARTVHTASVKNCRPLNLSSWLESNPRPDLRSQAHALRLEVISNIESERRACTGPPLAPHREVRKLVLEDPVLSDYIKEYAQQLGVTTEEALKEARQYMGEIASNLRVGVVRYVGLLLNKGFDRLLTGFEVDPQGIRFLSECDSRSRIVLVCCHKSYLDPLIIAYGICRSGLTPPQQAAGINLNIWPLGWVLRHCGAFYLRRTFAGETLYKEVFSAYVRRLLADNFITAFYIEGTRSRDGKLQKPKTGYMGILDEALRMGVCDDITLVPVYLGYDRVPEEDGHVREMAGGWKISETLKLFSRIYESITTTLGRAYVKFGAPMSFRALVEEHGIDAAANIICDEINSITVITARSVAACALLASGRTWVSSGDFDKSAGDILELCRRMRLPMATDADRQGVRAAADWFAVERRVVPKADQGVDGFRVEGYGRRFLEYNKNILLAHLLKPSMAAVAGRLGGGDRAEESLLFLKRLLAGEFVFGLDRADEAWKPVDHAGAEVLGSLLDSFLEGYLVACLAIGSLTAEEPVVVAELVALCFAEGERMLDEGSIRREESLSRILFKNAVKNYQEMGLLAELQRNGEAGREETALIPGERFDERGDVENRIDGFLKG